MQRKGAASNGCQGKAVTADGNIYAFGGMRPGSPKKKPWAEVLETCKGKWVIKSTKIYVLCSYIWTLFKSLYHRYHVIL